MWKCSSVTPDEFPCARALGSIKGLATLQGFASMERSLRSSEGTGSARRGHLPQNWMDLKQVGPHGLSPLTADW